MTPEWRAWVDRAKAVKIADIAHQRGIKLARQTKIEFAGPCPLCRGNDRFSINTAKDVFNCRGCGGSGRGAISFVRWLDGCTFLQAVETITRDPPPAPQKSGDDVGDHDRDQHRKAAWLWSQRRPIAGTIAERYLREVRGITCPLPATLAFLPARKPGHHPAMIAAFALTDEPEPGILAAPRNVSAVHLTLLKPDGSGKADVPKPKLMIGSPGNLPIVLAPANDLGGLATTEGIEDGLSVFQATGLGVMVAGAAGRMPGLAATIPDYIEAVTIWAHPDPAGQKGARGLAEMLHRRGIEVRIVGLLARSLTDRDIVAFVGGDQ